MRVLVITPLFPSHPEDPRGSFVLDSVDALSRAGHDVHVLVTWPYASRWAGSGRRRAMSSAMAQRGFGLTVQRYAGIPHGRLRAVSNELYVRSCVRTAADLAAHHRVDVIHAHTDVAGYLAVSLPRRAVVTTLHGVNTLPRYAAGWGQHRFFTAVCSRPDRLVLVGEPLRCFVAQYAGDRHVRVVPNGFRVESAAPWRHREIRADRSPIRIISVSNLHQGKGIDTNLRALASVHAAGARDWHYDIVGGGGERGALEAMTRDLGLSAHVTFHGERDHDEVFAMLGRSDVFALPSSPEAFGVAYLEAMACGLLTIGAEGEGPSGFITDGKDGLLVRAGDPGDLAATFQRVLGAAGGWAEMARAGRTRVWEQFTWDAHARQLSVVLEEAIESAGRSRALVS